MHHGAALRREAEGEWIEEFLRDFRSVPLPPREAAMLAYCEKLAHTPPATAPGDVARLREVGVDDRAILDVCQIAAYFAYVNRLAEGLGVELEPPDPSAAPTEHA